MLANLSATKKGCLVERESAPRAWIDQEVMVELNYPEQVPGIGIGEPAAGFMSHTGPLRAVNEFGIELEEPEAVGARIKFYPWGSVRSMALVTGR